MIAGKLAQGVSVSKILDQVTEQMCDVTRDTLVNSTDIRNIQKQYNISRIEKHPDDATSVDITVQEWMSDPSNPIMYYKPQTEPDHVLKPEDFLLCIQTDFQRNMMLQHASKIILVDSTHCTTQYDFLLTTVHVLDEYEEHVPVAWAISNWEDAEVMEIFFKSLKDRCGQDIQTDIFMSDLANNFYNAWCLTFPQPTKRLYCVWHVLKCWKKKIQDLMHSDIDRNITYSFLTVVQEETDESKFRALLQQFMSFCQKVSPSFHDYFTKNFVQDNKFFLWASCFRLGAIANTNMYAESFHRILKGVYFDKKTESACRSSFAHSS